MYFIWFVFLRFVQNWVFVCGMILGVLHVVVIEKLGNLGVVVNSLRFHMS